jgi:hypothetical protein
MLIVGGVVFYALTLWRPGYSANSGSSDTSISSHKTPDIELKLVSRIMGSRVYLINTGDDVARDITLDFVCWRPGAPGPDREETYPVRDLIPHSDVMLDIDFRNPHMDADYKDKLPTCGYFAVSSSGMARPKGWAFWLPGSDEDHEKLQELGYGGTDPWPIVPFQYPEDKPNWGVLVDYPEGVVTEDTQWRWNSVAKRNEWRGSDGSWNAKLNAQEP